MRIQTLSPAALNSIKESTARINIWEGSVRSGKTVASLIRWIEYALTGPPGPLLMAGKTERTLKRNVLDILPDILGRSRFKLNTGSGQAVMLGRTVYIAGANDARSEHKIRGLTLAGAYGDEISLWPESFFVMLLSRLSVPGAAFFGTTNPDNPAHWLKKQFIDREGELSIRSFHFTLNDNPSLDRNYIEQLKKEYTGLWYRRYVEGLWVAGEGAIYDMLDIDRHVAPFPAPGEDIIEHYAGLDYGTSGVTVCWLIARTSMRLHALSRWRWDAKEKGRQLTDIEIAEELARWLEGAGVIPAWFIVPGDAASLAEQLLRMRDTHPVFSGLSIADRSPGSVNAGIRVVSALLAAGKLTFDESLYREGGLDEWLGYVWDPAAQERGEDRPLKRNDHDCDAARYAIYGTRMYWGELLNNESSRRP